MKRSVLVMLVVVMFCLSIGLFTEQVRSQTSSINVTPEKLTFVGEENHIFSLLGNGKKVFSKTIIVEETLGNEVANVTLVSTDWYNLNSSSFISAHNVHFSPSSFSIPPRDLHEVIVTLETVRPRKGTYQGFVFVFLNGNSTLKVESTLIIRENVVNNYLLSSVIVSTIILAFWILLRKKGDERIHLLFSLILLAIGLVSIVVLTPFKPELNTIMIPTLFTPLIAYIINKLKTERDFWKKVDEASHKYRNELVDKESDLIGSLLWELSTHYAAFKAKDWPQPCCLSATVWRNSKMVGLIAETSSAFLAKYYHYVPLYNICIKNIAEKRATPASAKHLGNVEKFLDNVRKHYADVEDLIYHLLIYDLGFLQQKYIARPTVHFPYQMSVTLKEWLKKLEIIEEGEKIDQNVYSAKKAKEFNIKMKIEFNKRYAILQQSLNELIEKTK